MSPTSSTSKVIVIGVDGGTFDLIQPMMDRGLLPTFANLMKTGSWGTLRSTVPHVSPVAWSSFMTGQNPAKHRILDFTYSQNGSVPMPVNSTRLHGKTVWQILSEAGKHVGVINVPVTFPPQPVNGFLISGFPMPINATQYVYPEPLARELENHGWFLNDIATQNSNKNERDQYIAGLYRRQEERMQAAMWLMQEREWDLMMIHLFETDRIQHDLLNDWVKWAEGDTSEEIAETAVELEKFFQKIDEDIARLMEFVEDQAPGCSVVIMSDHGFGPTYKTAHVYNFLAEAGLMKFKSDAGVTFKRMVAKAGLTPINLNRMLPTAVRSQLQKDTYVVKYKNQKQQGAGFAKLLSKGLKRTAQSILLSQKDIDWQKSRAYCAGTSGIVQVFVNLAGREPNGIVPQSEYEATRDEIIAALREWRDPDNGQPIVTQIYRREEIYDGPYLEEAADVIALLRGDSEYIAYSGPGYLTARTIEPDHKGRANHKLNGFFFIKDARVRPGYHANESQIMDLAPTLLYMMGMPVPSNMDGAVMTDCFKLEQLEKRPPEIVDVDDEPEAEADEGTTEQEEASMMAMLKALGYVE